MKYKMVAMDMDGTLLADDTTISERNRQAIKKASDMGVKVVICTGRMFASARHFGDLVGVNAPIIASNGAYIRERDREEVIYANPLGEENARNIVDISHRHNLYCHFFSWDSIYTEKLVFSAANYNRWNKMMPEEKQIKIHIIDRADWNRTIKENSDKILKVIVTNEDIERIVSMRQEVSKLDVDIASSYRNNFEVMNRGVSKGNGVAVLAKHYGIGRDEIICMGDNENDISMIEYAGLGIAMGNGTDEAKEAADFVTLSNKSDGVAYAIEKFILNS